MHKKLFLIYLLFLTPTNTPALKWSPKNIAISSVAGSALLGAAALVAKSKIASARRLAKRMPTKKNETRVKKLNTAAKALGFSALGVFLLGGLGIGLQYWSRLRTDANGNTKQHRAAANQDTQSMLQALNDYGINLHTPNRAGETPMDLLCDAMNMPYIQANSEPSETKCYLEYLSKYQEFIQALAENNPQKILALLADHAPYFTYFTPPWLEDRARFPSLEESAHLLTTIITKYKTEQNEQKKALWLQAIAQAIQRCHRKLLTAPVTLPGDHEDHNQTTIFWELAKLNDPIINELINPHKGLLYQDKSYLLMAIPPEQRARYLTLPVVTKEQLRKAVQSFFSLVEPATQLPALRTAENLAHQEWFQEALHYAVMKRDAARVKALMSNIVSDPYSYSQQLTADDVNDVIRVLITLTEGHTPDWETALGLAQLFQSKPGILSPEKILENAPRLALEARDEKGRNFLIRAIIAGDSALTKALIAKGMSPRASIDAKNRNAVQYALLLAPSEARDDILQALLDSRDTLPSLLLSRDQPPRLP